MSADSEQLRVCYEGIVKQNPSNIEAVNYLAVWHLERHSFQQARKYFGHLATLKHDDPDVLLCLSVCCAMAEEFAECSTALKMAKALIEKHEEDVRVKFCHALMSEKRKDYTTAMEGYVLCLNQCATTVNEALKPDGAQYLNEDEKTKKINFFKELRGEIMLRIAVLKKEMGALDQSMQMCNTITSELFGDSIRANALCLKGLLHEMRAEFPASEVVYRSVLQITTGHSTALERLGRVYLRYRETIPAAVQCFFKSVETNPSNHVAWYLLGRCYMATSQYSDACEAYNRAVNLNPNDPQVWCSLGVLYYAFGQYREALGMLARALKLDSTMADAWYNVGALYDMCDQPEDAQHAYMKAKENGLADRFAKAGMGLNPLAMQSLQQINASSNTNNTNISIEQQRQQQLHQQRQYNHQIQQQQLQIQQHGHQVAMIAQQLQQQQQQIQQHRQQQQQQQQYHGVGHQLPTSTSTSSQQQQQQQLMHGYAPQMQLPLSSTSSSTTAAPPLMSHNLPQQQQPLVIQQQQSHQQQRSGSAMSGSSTLSAIQQQLLNDDDDDEDDLIAHGDDF